MNPATRDAMNKFGAQPASAAAGQHVEAKGKHNRPRVLEEPADSFAPEVEPPAPRLGRLGRDRQVATAEAAIALMRKRAWDDFYYFAKYVVGFDKMEEQPHRELCDLLCAGITESPTLGIDCVPPNTTSQRKSLRKLILWPRGSFKCVPESTLVTMYDGSVRRIADVAPGDVVLGVNTDTLRHEPALVLASEKTGVRPAIKLTTSSGQNTITTSPEHRFFTERGYVEAKDLVIGDWVALSASQPGSPVFWRRISSIEHTAAVPMCDISTTTENFIAHGFVVHNSSISSQAFPLWLLWHNPNLRILIDSETMHNAKTYLAGIRSVIEHNRMVRLICVNEDDKYALEPAYKTANGFTDDSVILATRTNANLKEPTLFCSGVDNARTGMHVDVIIMDDLVSERNVTTTPQIEKTYDHYRMSRSLLDPGGLQVVIGTRYHLSDMYGQLIDLHSRDAIDDIDSMSVTVKPAIDDDGVLLFPQRLTNKFLEDQRKAQGSYIFSCNPKGAPVLMADWSFKDISEIRPGDRVIGFELTQGGGERSCLAPTTVHAVSSKVSPVQRVVFDDGTEIRCTPDHKWYTGRQPTEKEPHRKSYVPAKAGSNLLSVSQAWRDVPSVEQRIDYAYLAAMIDGEGAVKHGSICITQDEVLHPGVCARIEEVLQNLDIPYNRYRVPAKPTQIMYIIAGGRDIKLRILRNAKLGKAGDLRDNMWKHAKHPCQNKRRVVATIPDGEEEVFSFQTGTGNYVVWGFMSKNCQYMLNPIDAGDAVFQDADIQRYDTIPNESIVVKYLSVDPTVTDKARSDFFVVMVVGITRDNHVYVLDYVQKKMLPREGIQTIISMYQKWSTDGKLRMVGIETYAAQRALKLPLREEMMRCGVNFRIAELNHGRTSKEDHIMTKIQPVCERHELHVRPHMMELINQLVEYPRVRHDDLLDGLAYAIQMMRPGGASFEHRKPVYEPVSRKTGY